VEGDSKNQGGVRETPKNWGGGPVILEKSCVFSS
jgi:hypothetical protein